MSRQCHNRDTGGKTNYSIPLPAKAISSGQRKKEKGKNVDWASHDQCCKLSHSDEMTAAREPRLSYILRRKISQRLYFIYELPFHSQHRLFSVEGALGDSTTVCFVCYHKKTFSLDNHWNLFSLSCYHMPNTFSTSSIFIIYVKLKSAPPPPAPTKMSALLGL